MKVFKTTDDKISELGFNKTIDDEHMVRYERVNEHFGYTHRVDLLHKKNIDNIIQSYDLNLIDEKFIGNTCIGLTAKEAVLFGKKLKKKWKR